MKFYKIIGTAALALLLGVSAVSADSAAELDIADDGMRARLSGTLDMHDYGFDDMQIKNYEPYYPLQIAALISDPESGEVLYANQTTADGDGAYSVEFMMPVEFGTYNLRLYTAYGLTYDGTVEYKDGTIDKFNSIAASGDLGELKGFISSYNKYFKIDTSLFNKYTDEEKDEVYSFVMRYAPYDSKAAIRANFSDAAFNVGLTTETLTADEKTLLFNDYMTDLGEEYGAISAFVGENALGSEIIGLFNAGGYSSIKEDIYSLALRAYLSSCVDNIYDLEALFGDDNLFSIPTATFNKYKKSTKRTVFFNSLYEIKDSLTDTDKFYDAIEKCIPSESKPGGSGSGKDKNTPKKTVSGPSGGSFKPAVPVPPVPVTPTELYSDLDSYGWAKTAITELSKSGAINGSGNGMFMPSNSITREEFAKISALAFDITADGGSAAGTFADVKDSDWFSAPINALVAKKIINGVSDTEFGVGRPITRQEAAAILARILNIADGAEGDKFADDAEIAEYAKAGIYALKGSSMLSGYEDNTFRPSARLTRAEAAQMIYNIIKLGKGGTTVE